MVQYVDSCLTYEILLQDSGLLPKPKEDWNVFVPQLGDVAHVNEDDSDYEFDGVQWVKKTVTLANDINDDGEK